MKHPILAATIFLFLSACSAVDSTKTFDQQQAAALIHEGRTTYPTKQMIKLSLPNQADWKKMDVSYGTIGSPAMLVPNDESMQHWTQSVRTKIKAYREDPDLTADNFVQSEITRAKNDCSQVRTDYLALSTNTVTYQLSLSGCRNQQNQIQIGKAFAGSDAIYVVYYSAVNGQVSDNEIRKLASAINSAKLVAQ